MEIIIILIGSSLGSFSGCLSHQLINKQNIFRSRSHCDYCKTTLKWYYLIPIISYLALKGKSGCCGKSLSIKYLIYEIVGALISLMLYQSNNFNFISIYFCFILSLITIMDYETYIIEDYLLIALLPISLSLFSFNLTTRLIYAFICFISYLVINLIKANSIGGGDIKLNSLLAFSFGPYIIMANLISYLLGGIVSIYLLKTNYHLKYIAFGPYLVIGYLITYLYNLELINWYLKIML